MSNVSTDPWGRPLPPPRNVSTGERRWYRKKRWIAVMAFGALYLIGVVGGGGTPAESAPEPVVVNTPEASTTPPSDVEPVVDADEPEPEPEPTPSKKPKPTKPKFHKADYADLTDREFSKIVRDPDAHIGEKVLVFGDVFQFDTLTGSDQFLANVGGDRDTEGEEFGFVSYDHNALMATSTADFDDVVEGDHIAAWATVMGSFEYDTQIGGSTSAVAFTVERVKVLGHLD